MIADVKTINTCCDNCKDTCLNLDYSWIKDVLYAGKILLSDNSLRKNLFLKQGYIKGLLCKDKEVELTANVELLEKSILHNTLGDHQKCLCDDEISQLIDNILGIADISCCKSSDRSDLIIDSSGYDQWVLENPYCQVYESWEAAYIGICTKFNISEVFKEQDPQLMYDLSVANIDKKCELVTSISVQNDINKKCHLQYEATVDLEKCKLDYEILVLKKDCELTYDAFVTLIKCGVKSEVISSLIECGFKIEPNVERRSCDIYIDADTKITLCDYKFNINSENINCEIASSIIGVNLCN